MQNFMLYAKFQGQKTFRPLDINEGYQVKNKIRATLIPEKDLSKLNQIIKENQDIEFKIVKC